jgi:hypothetical protein
MNWIPQIGAGSIAQFPLQLRRKWRAIVNELENGERIALADPAARRIEWRLSYRDLSEAEAAKLRALFAASKGSFGSFAFADPLANLLGWSEDLTRPDWQAGLLTATPGASDLLGTQKAWTLSNNSPGSQTLSQTMGIPGDYVGCFSAWIRADVPGAVTLERDTIQVTAAVGPAWKQSYVSGTGTAGAAHSTVSLRLAAGQSIQVWGLQFEAQPYASQYKPSAAASGIYPETWFATDELTMTSTGVGLTACEITLVSRV